MVWTGQGGRGREVSKTFFVLLQHFSLYQKRNYGRDKRQS